MNDPDGRPERDAELRGRAEALVREGVARTPEDLETLSPGQMWRLLHDLRVHQIELEMQNEELRRTQAELDAARTRYFDLYDLAPVGYCTVSESGLTLEANLTAARLLGVARSALVRQPFSRFILDADRDVYYLRHKQLFATGAPQVCEVRMATSDGAQLWARLDATVAPEADGGPVCHLVLIDVTEGKQAEEDLRRQTAVTTAINRVLQGVLQVSSAMEVARICLGEAEALTGSAFGWIGEVNPAGRMDTIALSDPGWEFCGMEGNGMEAAQNLEIFGRVMKDGTSLIANDPGAHPDRVGLPDGHPALTAFLGVPLKQHGRTVGMIALANKPSGYTPHDQESIELLSAAFVVSLQRKRAEAERERLMTAIEQADEVVFITDPAGAIQYVNPAFERTTGYSRQEVVGQTPRILKSGKQSRAFYRELWETIAGGRTWQGRTVNRRKDGTLYTEESTVSPVCDASGRIVNYVAVKRDITGQLRLEDQLQQAQKMESVGRLAGGVAHDFNNMLGVILGYAEMALDRLGPSDPLHADLVEIRDAASRSADLTQQLLAFARKQTVAPTVMDLNETVGGMLKMLKRLIGEGIDLAWLPGAGLWPVKVDPSQIDQILANLCVNVRDAIAGVGKVTIETGNAVLDEAYCVAHPGAVPGEFALLAVSDNGCGMDAETLAHIFEPFFTTKGVGEGTGLGLATVYGIVKQNNGFIDVSSEPDQGTTFRIYLPRHTGQTGRTPAEGAAGSAPRGHETILLVEDEQAILRLTTTVLERQGYTLLAASTPGEAIRLAREHAGEIHLLMTDVVMPEMNGRDLARNLLSLYPGVKRLFMSGYTADVIADQGVLADGVHFLQKPFSAKELTASVRRALDSE